MSQELLSIHQSINRFMENFTQPLIFEGWVGEVNQNDFVLILANTSLRLKCCTSLSLQSLTVNTSIIAKGTLQIVTDSTQIFAQIVEFYPLSDAEQYLIAKTTYDKYKDLLNSPKYISYIQKSTKSTESCMHQIGLIAIDSDHLTQFVDLFAKTAKGTLHVYRLMTDHLSDSLIKAMDYFQKMDTIDAIVFLTPTFTQIQTYQMCSKEVIRFLLNTIKNKCILSVTNNLLDASLVDLVAYQTFTTTEMVIDYLITNQTVYRNQLLNVIENGKAVLHRILENEMVNLASCRAYAHHLNPKIVEKLPVAHSMQIADQLKWTILRSLKAMQATLMDIRAKSLSYLINDYRTKKFIHCLIENEKNITLSKYIKYSLLSQNPVLHSNTELINQIIKTMDRLTAELHAQKMENKLPFMKD